MITRARVVKVHPAKRTLDCVDLDTGRPIAGVAIMSATMSSDTGLWAVPSVPRPSSHQSAMGIQDPGRVMVAYLLPGPGGRYVCIGFGHLSGATGALTEQDDHLIYRHPSGTTIEVQPDGTTVTTVPGGVVQRLNVDGTMHTTAPTKLTYDTPLVEITGELLVKGNITTEADTITSTKSFLQHRHQEQGDFQETSVPL